ncbi:hypothetical protein [Flavicella sediminum]|uniref:hypothetical protein n=1 Tax=Flavicella sediminum TaxID=2585141 RepID=UPI001123CA1E|nr:hypothetical protein [Flavicella sediminum]
MSKLYVIGTAHYEDGVCTSEKLYEIIEEISPEVVFCETSKEKLPEFIKRTDVSTPEMNVIKRLIKDKPIIDIVPIDEIEDPFDRRLEDMHSLFKRVMKEYKAASSIITNETFLKGFAFLNSSDFDRISRDQNLMEEYILDRLNNKELSDFHAEWLKWNDLLENQWISLIHDYFKINKPKKAVFLVGAGHRYRLIDKIKNIVDSNKPFLDCFFFLSNKT